MGHTGLGHNLRILEPINHDPGEQRLSVSEESAARGQDRSSVLEASSM